MKIDSFNLNRLPIQLVLSFLVVVLVTFVFVGLPAIWLLQNQLDQQAWAQVEQAERTAISLYEKKVFELKNTANFIAQRPTLYGLLKNEDYHSLENYLATLQAGLNLNLINICQSQAIVPGTESQILLCDEPSIEGYYLRGNEAWLITRTLLNDGVPGEVIIGIELDDDFAVEIKDQIGQDQALFYHGKLLSSSFLPGMEPATDLEDCLIENTDHLPQITCSVGDIDHYITVGSLDPKGITVAVAMDISEIARTQNRLIMWMTAVMVGIAGIVSTLGMILSRRISQPLVKLSNIALSFSRGDLDTPVVTKSKVIEITRMAQALENARLDLQAVLISLKGERDWSENLLSSIVEGILTLDQEGRITFFSRGAERLTGLLGSDVLGRHINDVFPLAESEELFIDLLSSSPLEGYQKVDVNFEENRILSLAITSAKLTRSEKEEQEIAIVIRDISQEEAVHRLLGHFLANVSHELRTPLSALEASIEILLDPDGKLSREEINKLHVSLHLGIFRLHTLVDNLLESANIEARRFQISPREADLTPIISEAVQIMKPLLSKYDQRLSVEMPLDPPRVKADKRRIVQVLVILISNANKYGPPGEEICLEVKVVDTEVWVAVLDRGAGIPVELRKNIFERFVYPHHKNEISQAGAGLGLSVVNAIVEAHGGRVGVEDRPGGGLIFWFTLPLANEE